MATPLDTPTQEIEAITSKPLGIEAFDALRAEAEPWFPQAFEAPPEFDLVSGPRSCIIFGEPGSGKSGVYQALLHSATASSHPNKRLIAEWRPRAVDDPPEGGSAPIKRQISEIFDACALSTARHLVAQPDRFHHAPPWARRLLHWFVKRHLRGDLEARLSMIQPDIDETGQQMVAFLLSCPESEPFTGEAAPEEIIVQLVAALAKVQLQGVWVLVEPVDNGEPAELVQLAGSLRPLLSRLNLFEQNGFTFKFFLAQGLRNQLANVSGIERRRLSVHYLQWPSEKLSSLLTKRMSLAVGATLQNIEQICSDQHLVKWLERCGGTKPRGWLEQFRPLAAAYLERLRGGQTDPISADDWRKIRQRNPPRLAFDREQRTVWVEERKIDLTEEQFKIFAFLYQHPGEVCSRSQLYYLAYLSLTQEARAPGDDKYAAPNDYRGLIETAIWRLRQSIEPYEAEETFIITVKGKGYRLDHT